MAATPEYIKVSQYSDLLNEVYKFVDGITGWIIDKYATSSFNYDNEISGPFAVGEIITWAGGAGVITILVDNGLTGTITFYLTSGINPVDGQVVSGTTATCDVDTTITVLDDTELYIHTIASDTTVAYYSMSRVNLSVYQDKIFVYPNLGFDSALTVNTQPGVPTNANGAMSYEVITGIHPRMPAEAYIVGNDNYLWFSSLRPSTRKSVIFDHVYMGNTVKDFAFVGGQFIQGSAPTAANASPPSAMYYDDTVAPNWYTEDAGAFADVGGVALSVNHIYYASAEYSYSHLNAGLLIQPLALFVEFNGGFAPVGNVERYGTAYNRDNQLVAFGHTRLEGIEYLSVPNLYQANNHHIIEIGVF